MGEHELEDKISRKLWNLKKVENLIARMRETLGVYLDLSRLMGSVEAWVFRFESQGANSPICYFVKNETMVDLVFSLDSWEHFMEKKMTLEEKMIFKRAERELRVMEEKWRLEEIEAAINNLNPDAVWVVAELPMLGKLLLKRFWKEESDYEAYRIVTAILEYKDHIGGKIYSWIWLLVMDPNSKKLIRVLGFGSSETLDFKKCQPLLFEVWGSEGIFLRWGWWSRLLSVLKKRWEYFNRKYYEENKNFGQVGDS
jgi:hypothetical protein